MSRAVSRAESTRSGRSLSRPSRPNSVDLTRVHSARFVDDVSIYHDHEELRPEHLPRREEEEELDHTDTTSTDDSSVKRDREEARESVDEKADRRSRRGSEISDEILANVPTERDLEFGPRPEKKSTTKDPNLVSLSHFRLHSQPLTEPPRSLGMGQMIQRTPRIGASRRSGRLRSSCRPSPSSVLSPRRWSHQRLRP